MDLLNHVVLQAVGETTQKFTQELIVPFLKGAFDVISIVGGIALWIVIFAAIVHAIEYKISPTTGLMRGFILWNFINQFKAIFIALIMLYVLVYTIGFVANYFSPGAVANPHDMAIKFIVNIFVTPWVKLYELISSSGWSPV